MSRYYLIYNENDDYAYFIKDEKVAGYFCNIKNEYFKDNQYLYIEKSYSNDIRSSNVQKDDKQCYAEALNEVISEIKTNAQKFTVYLDDVYKIDMGMQEFEDILIEGYLDDYFAEPDGDYKSVDGEWLEKRKLTEEDLPAIRVAYKDAKKILDDLEAKFESYNKNENAEVVEINEVENQKDNNEKTI